MALVPSDNVGVFGGLNNPRTTAPGRGPVAAASCLLALRARMNDSEIKYRAILAEVETPQFNGRVI
ncbi:hypothetical protein [Pseudomonas sp. Irchel s3h17]|uniref:hypothetical protein n=1 Tax=Pseudomonas sp. Irchel s3h17 TaxID=2009182 RepID=UPI000BA4DDBC|nr:hypothetical protein [Pseudomonas sp. Irchel s3h17]